MKIKHKKTANGIIYLESTQELSPYPHQMTNRLIHWAQEKPDAIFLGERDENEEWRTISFQDMFDRVRKISQWILDQDVSVEKPIVIIAENSIAHASMALAALHIGIPYTTISPNYVVKSNDYFKLKSVIDQLTPSIIMVSNGVIFEDALKKIEHQAQIVFVGQAPAGNFSSVSFEQICLKEPTSEVNQRYAQIRRDTIAKILFTSGSTGTPKGVINTHGNITSNWQQITQVFPFMENGFELLDWLPWSHTFGSNHNLGLTLYNGGTLYIDNGKPTKAGIEITIKNLRERAPTIYFNVPKGFEELIVHLKADQALNKRFFSNLKMLFYAGAGMPQHVWDALDELAMKAIGKRVLISTALGCTESSPAAIMNAKPDSFAGMLGFPVPGLTLKLVPMGDKLEARYKGPNITPAYWRNIEATLEAFDEEGFFKTGDALRFVDKDHPNEGLIFDGRIAENFKLSTGTWVNVGALRRDIIKVSAGFIKDAVITGQDRNFVGAILFLNQNVVRMELSMIRNELQEFSRSEKLHFILRDKLNKLNRLNTGSASKIVKVLVAPFLPSIEMEELTEKGSINQKVVLKNNADYVGILYSNEPNQYVISLE